PTDAGVAEVAAEAEARTRRLRKHLAAAEAARRAGNFIRQLTEADFALELSPREPRARFLAADALIQSGDLTKGCKYLSRLRTAEARQRAQDAGCR
ncbi:MAG TPA: hypothetical protein PKU97_09710, partial [Kofleriaceae bacterium]|nr:hypothetical protein [Kofleriaceae bacterium]